MKKPPWLGHGDFPAMAMMTRSVNYLNSMRCPALGHLNLIDSSRKSPFLLVKSMHSRVDFSNIATHLWGSQCTLFWVASIVKISFVSGGVRSWWVGFRHERWKSGKKHENEISSLPVLKLLKSQNFGIKHISLILPLYQSSSKKGRFQCVAFGVPRWAVLEVNSPQFSSWCDQNG